MPDAARQPTIRRPAAIGALVLAGIMVATVGLALANPWRFTALYPVAHEGVAIAVLVLAGGLVATVALVRYSGGGRRAVFTLTACLVAVPALCVGLPVVAFRDAFRVASSSVLTASPAGGYAVVKQTSPDAVGVRLLVRSRRFLLSREAAVPVAECRYDPFERGVPAEAVRFTSETTIAVPIADQSTVVIRFDPDTLRPERTVDMC